MIFRLYPYLLFILLSTIVMSGGCAIEEKLPPLPSSKEAVTEENVDPSCAYFYFLWGNHAEYNEQFAEALEAYEKASICDPKAEYIAEKIPILLLQTGQLEEAAAWLENYIRPRPHKTVQRFMLARLKIQQDKEDEAIALYLEALEVDPQNSNIKLRLGLLYNKQGRYKPAEQIFKSILKTDNNSYFAILYLARLYVRTGELDLAENRYNLALDLNWSKELSFEIAEFYNLRKQFNAALDKYQDILEIDDKDESAALGMVQTLLFLEKDEVAIDELSRVRAFTTNPERIDLIVSQILINMGELDRAKTILLSILGKTVLAQANYLLSVIYFEEGNLESAFSLLSEIPKNSAEFEDSVLLKVRILEETDRSDQSIELLQKVLLSEDTRTPLFYSLLSSIFQKQEKQDDALKTLAEAVSYYKEDEQILYEYAILLEKSNNHDKAFSLMEKIISLNSNHPDALNFIGYTLADRNVDLEKAYEYIQKAIQLKPGSGYIQDSLGWVYFRLGQFNRARIELEKAIEMEPDDPFIYDHLGDTYRALSNKDKARQFYMKALEILTDQKKKKAIQGKIDELN
jgi:tetratricopeptide (TPR) repeat protein